MSGGRYDAVVVGAGPNGLAAAVSLAREGRSVCVLEARDRVGGGARSAELTLPGHIHDVCSAVHPMAVGSPFFRELPLEEHGLTWVHPGVPLAHPLDEGRAAVLRRSVVGTAEGLGDDGPAWHALMGRSSRDWDRLGAQILGPLRLPRHPLPLLRFAWHAVRSARGLATSRFQGRPARALFAGLAAHAFLPLGKLPSAAIGLVLGIAAHAVGWPFPRGGSERISEALASLLASLGGEVRTGRRVRSLDELPPSRTILLDVTPRQLLAIAGDRLPGGYRRRLRGYRYGPAAFKVDWALSEPIPWRDPACAEAGTVHVGGTLEEIAAAEADVWEGRMPRQPFVLVAQQSRFDRTRAPEGREVGWAYGHVPHGFDGDATEAIEAQVERFAPGFRDCIVGRHVMSPADLESYNPNYVGGDINGGAQDLGQLFTRPVARLVPYRTPLAGVYLCSSSTPPGGGVHGMCGHHAATAALRRELA